MAFSWFKNKKTKEHFLLKIEEKEISIFIHHERRNNSRISFGKKGIIIRLSNFLSKKQKAAQIQKILKWATQKIKENPSLIDGGALENKYKNGAEICLFDRIFHLKILEHSSPKAFVQFKEPTIEFYLPESYSEKEKQIISSKLMTRFLAKYYKPIIIEKLRIYNQKFNFGVLNQVRLKNNSSNWGSCSSKGNINISVRLFFAPEKVVNYVLLHELAHLKHPNHSTNFWNLVEKVCPEYKQCENWLKKNGKNCVV